MMNEDWVRQYKQKRIVTVAGMVSSCLIFSISPYVMSLCTVSWRLDCLLYFLGFLSLLYFGKFSLKCPKCQRPIYIGDAFSVQHCKACGSMLRDFS